MPKSSTTTIACALCVGAAPERYLPAALAAIAPAVDALVVNENSGLARSANLAILYESAFATRGALRVVRSSFVDFADMRNKAFAPLRQFEPAPDWVMFLDADEVHGEEIRYVAREILPRLPPDVGRLDAYTYHFFGTFRWITDIARRLAFYRYSADLKWVNAVHEKIEGLRGRARVVPYVYHHYGNVQPPTLLARKHRRYYDLGGGAPRPPEDAAATLEMYLAKAAFVRPFRGAHPAVVRPTLDALERECAAEFAALDAGFAARRTPALAAAAELRGLNEALRVALRRIEHPGFYDP